MKSKANIKVRECLAEHDIRQLEFAEIFGVVEQTMYRWLRRELPEEIQDKLCEVIAGDHEHIESLKEYFQKRTLSNDDFLLNRNVEKICREISDLELEADIEKEQEREQWLYERRQR